LKVSKFCHHHCVTEYTLRSFPFCPSVHVKSKWVFILMCYCFLNFKSNLIAGNFLSFLLEIIFLSLCYLECTSHNFFLIFHFELFVNSISIC
jgi:hypothetical protein